MLNILIEGYRYLFLLLAQQIGYGLGLIVISMVTSALMWPLMQYAMRPARREQEYQSVILPKLKAIKERFQDGAEQHQQIQALYERYGYNPVFAVRKVLPLFIQLPFLFFTYFMLRDTAELSGVSLLFIRDLGAPDQLLGGLNLLPFVMTSINIAAALTMPGFSRRDLVQAIAVSILFFFLLYTASAALLIYWSFNNLITLVRNVVGLYKNKILCIENLKYSLTSLHSQITNLISNHRHNMPVIAFFFATIAMYSTAVFVFQGSGSLSDKIAINMGLVSFHIALLLLFHYFNFILNIDKNKILNLLLLLFTIAGVCAYLIIIGDKVLVRSLWMYGKHPSLLRYLAYFECFGFFTFSVIYGYRSEIKKDSFEWRDCYLFSWIIILAIHYISVNSDSIFSILSSFNLALYMLSPVLTISLFMLLSLQKMVRRSVLFVFVLSSFLTFYMMPLFSKGKGFLRPSVNIWFQYLLLLLLISGLHYLYLRRKQLLFYMTVFISLLVVVNICAASISKQMGTDINTMQKNTGKEGVDAFKDVSLRKTNSVILLLYDGYPNYQILKYLGMQDDNLRSYLQKKGFTLYDECYSTAWTTTESISDLFNIEESKGTPAPDIIAGHNELAYLFRCAGYQTHYMICGYVMSKVSLKLLGTSYFPDADDSIAIEDVLFANIKRGFFSQAPTSFNKVLMEEWVAVKQNMLEIVSEPQHFLYAHSDHPGHTAWNTNYRRDQEIELALYSKRLKVANSEIRSDIEKLQDFNDSIIILASDHGAYLMGDSDHGESTMKSLTAANLLDRYGTFLAIKWPDDYKPCLELNVLQNVLLEVLIYLSEDTSLKMYAKEGQTRVQGDFSIVPAGAIKNSIIQTGVDKGKNLFKATRERLLIDDGVSN